MVKDTGNKIKYDDEMKRKFRELSKVPLNSFQISFLTSLEEWAYMKGWLTKKQFETFNRIYEEKAKK